MHCRPGSVDDPKVNAWFEEDVIAGKVKLTMKFQAGLMIVAGLALAPFAARGADSSFTDLLARAHAEADAGKQWSPRGDNVIETLMSMMPLLPQATPQQITEFESLVHRQQSSLGDEQGNAAAQSSQPASQPATAAPAPPGPDGSAEPTQQPSIAAGATKANPARTEQPGRRAAAAQPRTPAAPTRTADLALPPSTAPSTAPHLGRSGGGTNSGAPPDAAKSPNTGGDAKPAPPPQANNHPISPAEKLDADMYKRGKQAEAFGDIATARRYYQTAAEDNYRDAAAALSRLYDPDWLRQHTAGGIQPDPRLAQEWYDRAIALGNDNGRQPPNAFSER